MWLVVHFVEEDNVETVPKSWYGDDKCWWPVLTDTSKIVKLIEKNATPDEGKWRQVPARKIGKTYDSLAAARSARNKAQIMSEFSDSSPTGKGFRRRMETERYSPVLHKKPRPAAKIVQSASSSDEDENQPSDLSPFPPVLRRSPRNSPLKKKEVGTTSKLLKKNLFTKSPDRPGNDQEATCLGPSTSSTPDQSRTFKKTSAGSLHKRSIENIAYNDFELEVLRNLTLIKGQLRNLSDKFDEHFSEIRPNKDQQTVEQLQPILQSFPLKTELDLFKFDESLDDKGKKALIGNLASLGGANTSDVTKRILRYILTDHVASKYSWMGLKQKKAFRDLKLADVIQEAVLKNKRCSESTKKEIEDVIKNWLRVAKYRAASKKVPEEVEGEVEEN